MLISLGGFRIKLNNVWFLANLSKDKSLFIEYIVFLGLSVPFTVKKI